MARPSRWIGLVLLTIGLALVAYLLARHRVLVERFKPDNPVVPSTRTVDDVVRTYVSKTDRSFLFLEIVLSDGMDQADPKAVVRSYLAAFNDRDEATLRELLATDAVEHGIHDVLHGADEIVDFLDRHFTAFPDYRGTTEAMVAEGDLVSVRYRANGTHTGEYRDVEPTQLEATWTGMAMYRITDGEIVEIWLEEDRLGLLEQLELVETSEPAHLRL